MIFPGSVLPGPTPSVVGRSMVFPLCGQVFQKDSNDGKGKETWNAEYLTRPKYLKENSKLPS